MRVRPICAAVHHSDHLIQNSGSLDRRIRAFQCWVCATAQGLRLFYTPMASAIDQMTSELPCGLGPDAYSRWRASEIGGITDRLERQLILELVGDVKGCKILDVGCGDGEFAVELSMRGAIVVGIDASAEMIDAAKRRVVGRTGDIRFQVAKAEHIPSAAEQFDVVTAITILCFVDDAARIFQEIARVLRPGGRLIIGELGKWSIWAAGRRVRALLGSTLWRRGSFRTADELRGLAQRSGLVVETVRGAIYYPRCSAAARLMSAYDPLLSRHTTLGAAFLALCAVKPRGPD